jgi:oxygen-independent coproporphyrinogen III oxidase
MSALYLHIPFCRRKCPYCDFFSVDGQPEQLASYPDLLLRHLQLVGNSPPSQPLQSVFFGGGTPSLLPPSAIDRLLRAINDTLTLTADAEISLEANPGTLDAEVLGGYRAAGVNRLSLGVQSLSPRRLQELGRLHTPEQARLVFAQARDAGFRNISCDLMFALPGQSAAELQTDLEAFLALLPEHLSCYGLTVEEGTPFAGRQQRGELVPLAEEGAAEHFRLLHDLLTAAGYEHYEISNYARPGRQCRHNLAYWRREPVLGLGAGAHSFAALGWGERRAVPPDLTAYRQALEAGRDPSVKLESFERSGAMGETLYLGLRTAAGVSEEAFRARFGVGVAKAFPQALQRAGAHLQLRDGCWRLDMQGWLLYDYFIAAFL